jgi:DNA repair exonuclease SbcCD ATPase subunit
MSVNHNEIQKRTNGILDFTENVIKVSEHLNGAVGQAQALENELGGVGQQLRSFIKNELVPVLEEFENNPGSSKHQKQLAKLLQDEENLERAIKKTTKDIDGEISDLRKLAEELEELEENAGNAEQYLDELEDMEKRM